MSKFIPRFNLNFYKGETYDKILKETCLYRPKTLYPISFSFYDTTSSLATEKGTLHTFVLITKKNNEQRGKQFIDQIIDYDNEYPNLSSIIAEDFYKLILVEMEISGRYLIEYNKKNEIIVKLR